MSNSIYSWFLLQSLELLKTKAKNKEIDDEKREMLRQLILKVNSNSNSRIDLVNKLLTKIKEELEQAAYTVIDIEAKTKSRLLINLASGLGQTLFEAGISIHPVFNLPYIPSSSIKGAMRSFLSLNSSDEKANELFGNMSEVGKVIMLDSFPIRSEKGLLLEPEVTTQIYKGITEIETEPKPIIYPAIARGVVFRIIIGVRRNLSKEEREIANKTISGYMKNILAYGIGAKTLLGYGELEEMQPKVNSKHG